MVVAVVSTEAVVAVSADEGDDNVVRVIMLISKPSASVVLISVVFVLVNGGRQVRMPARVSFSQPVWRKKGRSA